MLCCGGLPEGERVLTLVATVTLLENSHPHPTSRTLRPTWRRGTRDKLATAPAADWLQRMAFCVGDEELMELFGEHYTSDVWRPPKHMSQ